DDDDRSADRRAERLAEPTAIKRIEDEAENEPAETGVPRGRVLHDDDEPRDPGAEPTDDRENRPIDPADAEARTCTPDLLLASLADAQRCDRDVRDREGEHRAERVHAAEEVDLSREQEERRCEAAEDQQREPRRAQARM